jgi:outer membrane lipoprotein carrier protein
MKPGFRFILLLAMTTAMAFATSFACASDPGTARSALERFANELDTLHAEFTQTVKSQDGRVQDETHGEVWLQSPDKLRWVYLGEFPETIVADGKNIWMYDESLQQVTIKPQSDQAADSPLMILADVSQIDTQFRFTELGEFEGMLLLELRSLDEESEFERILLGFDVGTDTDSLAMMAMDDAFGQRTEIRFTNVLRNQLTDPQLFSFTAPEGTDVVGVLNQPE